MAAHNVLLPLGIPRTPGVTDRYPGWNADRPGQGGERRGELFAIPRTDVEQEVLGRGNVVTPGDVEVVAKVRRIPQEVLQHPGPLVVGLCAGGHPAGEGGDPSRPAGRIRAGLAGLAAWRKLGVLRHELPAQVRRRSLRKLRRLEIGDLTLDRVGEPLLGQPLGVAVVYQRSGGGLVLEVDSSVVEHAAQLVGGRQKDVVFAARTLAHGLDQPPAVGQRGVDCAGQRTAGGIEARGPLPLAAVEFGQGHQPPVVALLGSDPHREDLLVAQFNQRR